MVSRYSLRSKLLVAEMDVSRTKIHLDTSIRATSNSEQREYTRSLDKRTGQSGIVNMDLFSQPSPNQHDGKSKLHGEEIGVRLLGVGLSLPEPAPGLGYNK